jgi:hypothetical protein
MNCERHGRTETMQITLIITLVLHVLSGVFWAGTTIALARTGADQADRFFRPQMGAAVVAVATGGLLWHLLHEGSFGAGERMLAIGALCAFAAAGVQGVAGGPALRKLAVASATEAAGLRHRVAIGQRVAAALLMVTVICMAASRYV